MIAANGDVISRHAVEEPNEISGGAGVGAATRPYPRRLGNSWPLNPSKSEGCEHILSGWTRTAPMTRAIAYVNADPWKPRAFADKISDHVPPLRATRRRALETIRKGEIRFSRIKRARTARLSGPIPVPDPGHWAPSQKCLSIVS